MLLHARIYKISSNPISRCSPRWPAPHLCSWLPTRRSHLPSHARTSLSKPSPSGMAYIAVRCARFAGQAFDDGPPRVIAHAAQSDRQRREQRRRTKKVSCMCGLFHTGSVVMRCTRAAPSGWPRRVRSGGSPSVVMCNRWIEKASPLEPLQSEARRLGR
jgi:hypothetical protein